MENHFGQKLFFAEDLLKVTPSVKRTKSIASSATSLENDSFSRGISFTWSFTLRSALYFAILLKFRPTTAWMRSENFKTQTLPLVVSNAAAVKSASLFFEEFTAAKSDRKMLPGGTKQCSLAQSSFIATLLSLKQKQNFLTSKEALLCSKEGLGYNNSDTNWRSLLSSVKIAHSDG